MTTTLAKPTPKKKVASDAFDQVAEEKLLRERYPNQQIVKGTLKPAGALPKYGNKRTVEIKCQRTGKPFRIATSDLHQVTYSPEAMHEIRLERRRSNRATATTKKKPAKAAAKSTAKATTKAKTSSVRKPRTAKQQPLPSAQPTANETPETPQPVPPGGSPTDIAEQTAAQTA